MANQFREAMKRMAQQMQTAGGSGGGGGGGGGPARAAQALASSITALAGAGALAYGAYHSMYSVQAGHRAVVFNRIVGMKDTVYGEGLNFNIPWFEHPVQFDIRTRPVNLQTLTGSKDLQMVTLGIRVLHKPDPSQLVWIYRFLGVNYDERVLPSIMNECAKAVVARYNASELLTKRELVSKEISSELRKRAMNFNILLEVSFGRHEVWTRRFAETKLCMCLLVKIIELTLNMLLLNLQDVAITHLAFSPEYARAVEDKQVALQDSERAKYVVIGAQQEKKTIITRARGEAESAELIGMAVKRNPGFMKLRRIDAARDIADTVAKSGNKVYLSADTLLLNLLGDTDEKFEQGLKKKGW